MADKGFHEGELAVQRRAGVAAQAERLGTAMLATPDLNGGISRFLADRDFAVITARDADGRLWISPLLASVGFLDAHDRTLRIHTTPRRGDPLQGLAPGQPVGVLVIEFATRRRVRVNGTLARTGADGLELAVDQAFGNCPKYIQQRHLEHIERPAPVTSNVTTTSLPNTPRSSPAPIPSSSAPCTRPAAPMRPIAAAHQALCASRAASCGGRITPATTCSTASAIWRRTRPQPCSSSTSRPASAFTSRGPRPLSGQPQASPETTAALGAGCASRSNQSRQGSGLGFGAKRLIPRLTIRRRPEARQRTVIDDRPGRATMPP